MSIDEINAGYKKIADMDKVTVNQYGEINPVNNINYVPNLIDIGTISNDEYSDKKFTITQKWQTPDTMNMCLQNAEKIINNIVWDDETEIRKSNPNFGGDGKGNYKIKIGLNYISMSASSYVNDNNNYFYKQQSSRLTNTTMTIPTGSAIELFGYFIPDVTGIWKFTIPNANITNSVFSKLWVSNNNALYDYTNKNADIINNTSKNGQNNTFSIKRSILLRKRMTAARLNA
jgi:hypothetical protein